MFRIHDVIIRWHLIFTTVQHTIHFSNKQNIKKSSVCIIELRE